MKLLYISDLFFLWFTVFRSIDTPAAYITTGNSSAANGLFTGDRVDVKKFDVRATDAPSTKNIRTIYWSVLSSMFVSS